MQTDYFLDIQDPKIEGESHQKGHQKEIEMDSWSWSQSQSGSAAFGSGSGSGRVTMHEFSFTKRMDQSTPKLQKLCSSGQHINKAVFTARRTGEAGGEPVDYLKFTFTDLILSSYHVNSGGEDALNETFSFSFATITIVYKQIVKGVAQGYIGAGYDTKANKKIAFA